MRRALLIGSVLLCAGALAACTSAGSSSGSNTGSGDRLRAPAVAGPAGSGAGGSTGGGSSSGGSTSGGSAGGGGAAQSAQSEVAVTATLDTGLRIRTAVIHVGIRGASNVAAKAGDADTIALNAGGEVDTDDRTSGRYATATVQVRVPPDQLEPVLDAFGRLGREQNRAVSSKDVTQQVADVTSRVQSATAAIAQLRSLYDRARKVADVISIEDQLSSRESDLESLQAEQRALDRETATAAITLDLSTLPVHKHHVAAKPTHSRSGFVGGLTAGWHGFTAAAGGVATAVRAALPFLVVLLLLGLALRLLWPRLASLRRGSAEPAPQSDSAG